MTTSQNLKPIVQNINKTTYFCFNVKQSRFLVKRLEHSLYQDHIMDTLKQTHFKWQKLVKNKDIIIFRMERQIKQLYRVNENNIFQIQDLNGLIKKQNKKIKQNKLQRMIFSGGLIILTGLIIAK